MLKLARLSLRKIALFAVLICASQTIHAAKLVSYCYMNDEVKTLTGLNVDQKLPIASVSKLFTSLFVTTTFNFDSKFYTQIFVTDLGRGWVDVHIQGSLDPYFNRFKMHMIISKLNEMRAVNIRKLTFDENVKYLHDTDLSSGFRVPQRSPTTNRIVVNKLIRPLVLKEEMNFPTPDIVQAELSQVAVVMKDYAKSQKIAEASNISLFKNPQFKVSQVTYLNSRMFKPSPSAQKAFVASQDMKTILKSMNWNSNNHAANQLFMAAGGVAKFHQLFYKQYGLTEKDLSFVNGSGQNHDLAGNTRLYNEASCRTVARTVRMLKKSTEAQKRNLQDIVAVMGIDIGSTVGGATYSNALTKNTVIAKTGTVATNVTLAGTINTATGPYYFMFNVATKAFSGKARRSANREEKVARAIISNELQKLIKKLGGAKSLNYVVQNPFSDTMENFDETDMEDSAIVVNTMFADPINTLAKK